MTEPIVYRKIVNYSLLIIITSLTLLIIWPYLLTIINAVVLAYLFFPINKRLRKYVKRRGIASFLTVMLILLLIILPIIFIINNLTSDVTEVVNKVAVYYTENEFAITDYITNTSQRLGIDFSMNDVFSKLTSYSITFSQTLLKSVPQKILGFFVFIVLLYYLLKDGDNLKRILVEKVPMREEKRNRFLKNIKQITHAIIYGVIITALIQGVIGGVGYMIVGFESPIFLGLLTAIVAVIPILGTTLVWAPASLYLVISGLFSQDYWLAGKGIALALYGFLIISTVDNIFRPFIISGKAKIHPTFILLGILGGISFFGFIGIVLGPLIISMFIIIADLHKE